MSDSVVLAIIVAVPPTITSIASVIVAVKNHKAVKEVHLAVNSRLDALLKVTQAASFAEGVKSEMDKRIDRLTGDG